MRKFYEQIAFILFLVLYVHGLKFPSVTPRFLIKHQKNGVKEIPCFSGFKQLQKWAFSSFIAGGMMLTQRPSEANALLTYPLRSELKNNIILMKSGQSTAEEKGIVETNPIKKLSKRNSLTEEGIQQVFEAANKLIQEGFYPSYIWAGNTERSYETGRLLAQEFALGQNRFVPEYSFLDARALGRYEGKSLKESLDEVHKQDELVGLSSKPERGEDETPSESITQVLARDNQLISTIESMYSGENVLVISPDSDVLSILVAALHSDDPDSDIPRHAQFHFDNGEFRPLKPYVKPFRQVSLEEEDAETRKMRAFRMKGIGEISNNVDDTWFDLWNESNNYQ